MWWKRAEGRWSAQLCLRISRKIQICYNISFHKTSAVLRMKYSEFLCSTCYPTAYAGQTEWNLYQTKYLPCLWNSSSCYCHTRTTGENWKNNFFLQLRKKLQTKQNHKKNPLKHAIILDVQFKTKNIFSRMWHLKLLKYGCHQQQLQEARTSAEQIISTYTARRKRGTFHTKFFMVATACQAWQKTWQKQAQIQFSRSSFYCLSLFFFTQVRISVLFFPSTVIKPENPCEGRVLSSRNQAETFTFKIRMQWFFSARKKNNLDVFGVLSMYPKCVAFVRRQRE